MIAHFRLPFVRFFLQLPAIRGYLQEDVRLIDLQDDTYGMSPLIWSVRTSVEKMLHRMVLPYFVINDASLDPHHLVLPVSLNCLYLKCVMGHDDVAAWLLARGASVDLVDSGGRSALFYASKIG
jgi:ankyrin repeat protein